MKKHIHMHDIGKIGVPNEILSKEKPLDNSEYEIVKHHAKVGGEILSHVHLFQRITPGVRYHHERHDGKGYPDHLAGEAIPYIARILSISDAVDAMTSQRSYNRRKSLEEAAIEIEKMAGTQFDPDLIKPFKAAFIKLKKAA